MAKIETYQYKHKDEVLPHMREITVIWVEDTIKDVDAVATFTGCTCKLFSDTAMEIYTSANIATFIHKDEATFVYRHVESGVITPYCYGFDRAWLNENYTLKSQCKSQFNLMKYTYFIVYTATTANGVLAGNNVVDTNGALDSLAAIRGTERTLMASIEGCMGLCITNFRLLKEEKA